MEDLKRVPAREMLHQAHIDLQIAMCGIEPNKIISPRSFEMVANASVFIKLLWEANRGY